MFALLEIVRIYNALKLFADLQGPICCKDPQNKGLNQSHSLLDIIRRHNRVKFAYHFHLNYDLNLEIVEFHALGFCNFGEILPCNAKH